MSEQWQKYPQMMLFHSNNEVHKLIPMKPIGPELEIKLGFGQKWQQTEQKCHQIQNKEAKLPRTFKQDILWLSPIKLNAK